MFVGFGSAPEAVVAFTGRGVREEELRDFFTRASGRGAREIFLFDPSPPTMAPGLLGYAFEAGRQRAIQHRDGAVESRVLGLRLRAEGSRLRALGSDGRPLPFPDELQGQAARAQADASRWKERAERRESELARVRDEARRQHERADHWKREAARLEEELRRLRNGVGDDGLVGARPTPPGRLDGVS
jgi:hypothetical protein